MPTLAPDELAEFAVDEQIASDAECAAWERWHFWRGWWAGFVVGFVCCGLWGLIVWLLVWVF